MKLLYMSDKKIEFKNTMELITYLTLNGDKNILQKDVKFILKNNNLYEENKKFYEYVVNTFKDIR